MQHATDGLHDRIEHLSHAAEEYARALKHYTQLVRHRIVNPPTVIRGSAQTLLQFDSLDDDTRSQLLAAIVEMTGRIEHVSLEPRVNHREETGFDPIPRIAAISHG